MPEQRGAGMRFKATFKTTDQSFAAGFGAVQTASDGGYDRGYEKGYGEGHTDGYESGYGKGSTDGYESGYGKGHTDGYDKGHTDGHDEGYSEGYDDGYEEGHGAVPSNARFQVVAYNADGYPLEVSMGTEGDTTIPQYCITPKNEYVSPFLARIQKVHLPSSVVNIPSCAFMGGKTIKEITNWDNIESMGSNAFESCTSLTHTYLPPKLTVINGSLFTNARIPIAYLPDGVTSIGGNAFYRVQGMYLRELPKSLVTVYAYAFYSGWATVCFSEIPESVQTIGKQAFYGACQGIVGNLTFKGTPTSIEGDAFQMGTNVTDVFVPWKEGEVANAPWGMTKATIHYESEV